MGDDTKKRIDILQLITKKFIQKIEVTEIAKAQTVTKDATKLYSSTSTLLGLLLDNFKLVHSVDGSLATRKKKMQDQIDEIEKGFTDLNSCQFTK